VEQRYATRPGTAPAIAGDQPGRVLRHQSNANEIHIQVEFVPQACVINVSDCGKGMSEQVMVNALVPFYSTKSTGSGLGLALCREIAEAHQGHISLHNKIEGGLNVQVSLPYS